MTQASDNFTLAADTTNMQAGGGSFFSDSSDAILKGGGAALVSGISSIYNTGVDAANYFGADAERINVHKALANVDENWASYYDQHQGVIDTAGFLVTSFIPGGLAVKGLNLVRRGEGAGAFARALNYTTEAQASNLEKALQTIASPEGSVFTKMNKNYLAALGWGVADQVIQTGAFEIAVAATMKASPILDGQSYKDISHDIVKNALIGGVFGGTIEGVLLSGIAKSAIKTVDRAQRKYDILGASESLGLGGADTAYSFIDKALALPKEVFAQDRVLDFTYRLNGKVNTLPGGLQTGELFDKALQKTVSNAYLDMEKQINTRLAVDGDSSVGKPVARMVLDILQQGKKSGADEDTIRSRIGDVFFNLKKMEPIGDQLPDVSPDKFFTFNKKASTKEFPLTPLVGDLAEGEQSFRIIKAPEDLRIATLGQDATTVKEAFDGGFDLVMKTDGKWTVNPKSSGIRPARIPDSYQVILNTKSGAVSHTATVTAADIATADSPLVVNSSGVTSGTRKWSFDLGNGDVPPVDAADATARHLWASQLKNIDGEVNANDLSVLDKMSSTKGIVSDATTVNVGGDLRNWRDLGNFDDFVFNNKLKVLQERLSAGEQDIQHLAYELNTSPQWIQDAIASKFNPSLKKMADNAPDLSSGWQRPLEDYQGRENVIMNYEKQAALFTDDFGNTFKGKQYVPQTDDAGRTFLADQVGQRAFITGSQAHAYKVRLAQDNQNIVFSTVFGADAGRFIDFTPGELEALADRNPTGAGLVSFSNADYGDRLRLFQQATGKEVHNLSQETANANLARIQPLMADIRGDAKASAELIAITTRVRRSDAKFTILDADYGLDGAYLIDKSLLKGATPETLAAIKDAAITSTQGDRKAYLIENESVASFLRAHMAVNGEMIEKRAVLANARGQVSLKQADTLYVPPIDTTKVPYFAFVRPTEGKIFGSSDVSMITARSDTELQQLAAQINPADGLEVVFKKDTERFFKAKGDYDFQRSLSDSAIDSDLKKQGRLGDHFPSFNVESTLEDFLNYHQRQATQLVRDGVSTKYAQQIAEFQRLSEQYTLAQTSKFGVIDKLTNRTLKDPYDDVIKGMLDISKRSEFTLLHQTNEMLDALGTRAYRAMEGVFQKVADKSAKGEATPLDWEQANSMLTKYGLGAPFKDSMAYDVARTPADRNLIKTALQKANLILSNSMLRFDFANSLINIISTPIMLGAEVSSIKNSIRTNPELAGKLAELTSLAIPEGTGSIPSTTKLIASAIKNFWGPEKDALIARYTKNGDINTLPAMFHEMTNDLSLVPNLVPAKYAEGVDKWVEKTAKVTGNTWAEQFTRFVSADVMRQISDPLVQVGKMSVQEQNAFMNIFVNRVQGNYIASQRPILFQGTLGAALGLFQTYQFNMMQQIFRHIENRDMKTLAVMGGLQTSVYGLNGLPFFEAVNTHLIGNANINDGHKDAYSYATQVGGKYGDWMMYGTASAFPLFGTSGPALYTRGDVNPRHPTIIPTTPQDIPAVDASIRFVTNLINTAGKVANGGDLGASLLEGLEHNSINRPLAGLAQALNGASTTSKGGLISSSQDLFSVANASRILGAKPLDESIGLNARYRTLAYQAEDKARLEDLGSAVKTTLRGNRAPTDEQMTDFMGKYAASGGRIENFGGAMQRWSKDANQSVLNTLGQKMRSSYGQRFTEVMGGKTMEDYRNTPPVSPEMGGAPP